MTRADGGAKAGVRLGQSGSSEFSWQIIVLLCRAGSRQMVGGVIGGVIGGPT